MQPLSKIIADEIRQRGPISMARFMELALYCPVYGYYERDAETVGRAGDFQTSVCVGPLFGELLAARAAAWLDQLREHASGALRVVEAGAHEGALAGDCLAWFHQHRPDLLDLLCYHILEPSPRRQQRQRARLQGFLPCLRWHAGWDPLQQATGGVCGVIVSNELLDAQPVHRFGWDCARAAWFEWQVGHGAHGFQAVRSNVPADGAFLAELNERVPPEVRQWLPDGYVVELSPSAEQWWRSAAGALRAGWLLTFDYGGDDHTARLSERTNGTLRGYRNHRVVDDVLANPGTQDLTAHVHFGRIRRMGESAGLTTEFFGEQGRFLTQCLADAQKKNPAAVSLNASRLRQFKTLIHPDHFGRSFRVLVQSRLPAGGSVHS